LNGTVWISKGGKFEIKGRIPSKKISYRVHLDQRILKALMQFSNLFRSVKRKWWVAPSVELREAETLIAWTAKAKLPDMLTEDLALDVRTPLKNDLDNLLGVILDGIEKSGRIKNDKQFKCIEIVRNEKLKNTEVTVWTL